MKINHCKYLTINIAGFNIVAGPLQEIEKRIGVKLLKPFISGRKQGMQIEIIDQGPISDVHLKTPVFTSNSHWQFYKSDKKYYYKITSKERGRDFISRLAEFSSDFSFGKIHTYSPVGDRDFPLSYPLDQILLIHLSALNKGILVHACGAALENKGLLFVGSSGAGKSTIGGLLKKHKNALILSDDRIVIRKDKTGFFIYGTPWQGTLKSSSPRKTKLQKIFFLKKSRNNKIVPLSGGEGARRLSSFSFLPYWEKASMEKTISAICELANKNIFYELSFYPNEKVADFLSKAA